MNTKISVRQICFIMLMYTAVKKFILYPTALSYVSGRDLLFSSLFDFLIQGIIVWAVSYLCSRTDKTFFELIEGTLGNVVARIIYGLFALFFMICTVIPLFEQKVYVHAIFYDTLPSLLVFLPFFIFSLYAASKSFINIGRCADICLPLFIISTIFIFSMSFFEVKWDNFLPMFKMPVKKIFGGSLSSLFHFAEPAYL
ncbi:MAG: spore germination protein, partial [Clostridia bacterium]|nr:spore germination protein [Clostridia bacterium]